MTNKPHHATERRAHARHQINIAEPIEIQVMGHTTPAILLNLSEGGLSFLSFVPIPVSHEIDLDMRLDHLLRGHVRAKVVRVLQKGQTYQIGVQLLELRDEWKKIVRHLEEKHKPVR